MVYVRFWGVAASLMLLLAGCQTVKRVKSDHQGARDAVTDLQTLQVFDNVVRLHKGLPIVHVDYKLVNARTEDTLSGEIGVTGSRERTRENGSSDTQGAALATVFTGAKKLVQDVDPRGNATGKTYSWLQIDAAPVVQTAHASKVYGAYLEFVDCDGNVECGRTPPAAHEVVMRRQYGGTWFWIPTHARGAFRKLSLKTLGYSEASPEATKMLATIKELQESLPSKPDGNHFDLDVTFTEEVPNRGGYLLVVVGGAEIRLNLGARSDKGAGEMTYLLKLQYPTALQESWMTWDKFRVQARGRQVELVLGEKSGSRGHGTPAPRRFGDSDLEYRVNSFNALQRRYYEERGRDR